MAEHHSSSSEPDWEERWQLLEQFDDIFSCTICLMKLDDPHLCPRCSKLYCYACISEWLQSESELHLYCPNCKYELQLDKLVKVRWLEETDKFKRNCIEQGASTSNNKETNDVNEAGVHSNGDAVKNDTCSSHLRDIRFYCCTCKLCVCDTCVLEDANHVGHTFKSLDMIYESDLQLVNEEFEKVTAHMEKIEPLIAEVDRNVELVKKMMEEKLQEVQSFAKSVTEELKQQANDILQKLEKHTDEMKNIEQSLGLMKGEVKTSSQPQFIAKKSKIIIECNKILENPIKDLKEVRVPINLKITSPTIYETGIFVIANISSLGKGWIQSKQFTDNFGHIWRIKSYKVKDFLALYLELVEGLPCRMECCFQLLHPDPTQMIERRTKQKYDCSGENEKDRGLLNLLAMETILTNFRKNDDSLEIIYHIRPYRETTSDSSVVKPPPTKSTSRFQLKCFP